MEYGEHLSIKLDRETARALRVITRRYGAGNRSEAIRAVIRLAAAQMTGDRQTAMEPMRGR